MFVSGQGFSRASVCHSERSVTIRVSGSSRRVESCPERLSVREEVEWEPAFFARVLFRGEGWPTQARLSLESEERYEHNREGHEFTRAASVELRTTPNDSPRESFGS